MGALSSQPPPPPPAGACAPKQDSLDTYCTLHKSVYYTLSTSGGKHRCLICRDGQLAALRMHCPQGSTLVTFTFT